MIEGYPLSPQQERLFSFKKNHGHYIDWIWSQVEIKGKIDFETFEAVIKKIVNENEIFRTNFYHPPEIEFPLQVIADYDDPYIQFSDLTHLNAQEQTTKLNDYLEFKKSELIDLEHNSLLEFHLFQTSFQEYILLILLPTLCSDRATLQALINEIANFYQNYNKLIEQQPLQYADLAEWQNSLLEDEETKSGREYWCNQDFSSLFNERIYEGKDISLTEFIPQSVDLELNQSDLNKINWITENKNISLKALLLSCWQVLLWRMSRSSESESVIGVKFDGRKYDEIQSVFGLFSKFLPIKNCLQENLPFNTLLEETNIALHEAYQWQEYFVWKDITLSHSSSSDHHQETTPFFFYCFDYSELFEDIKATNLNFKISEQYICLEPFKLKLTCLNLKSSETLKIKLHYNSKLFKSDDANTLIKQFHTLLKSVLQNPQLAIGEQEIITADQHHQLLVNFNQTQTNLPLNQCIHHLFEQQVKRFPDKTAIVFNNEQITFSQLNTQANKLAYHLQQLGISPEVPVGLYMNSSLEMIIGLLGIMKAGGTYVPLDPSLPTENLNVRIQDTGIFVVVTEQSSLPNLAGLNVKVVCLDQEFSQVDSPYQNPNSQVTSKNLAYLLYTSGSTGKPKGVAVEHRQLLNYLYGISKKLNLQNSLNFVTVSTFAADLSNTVIFSALCMGGCLHIISGQKTYDPDFLNNYFENNNIDCLKIVPSHLIALLRASSFSSFLPNKYLILGGETLSTNLFKTLQTKVPNNCQIINHYGPTETTVGVLTNILPKNMNNISETVPLGFPIANSRVYILNNYLKPVPPEVSGEIYIGGNNLTRGYLNYPDITAEKFIPDPFSQERGARLYKTGDQARHTKNGYIEYLGRIDNQVKIRGYRIELGEIEATLTSYPNLQQAVVDVYQDISDKNENKLIAYLVGDKNIDVNDLRQFLQNKLPGFMMPSNFVFMEKIPLKANGKIDRGLLPEPDSMRPQVAEFIAPRTEAEEVIVNIWQEVLGINKIGVYDNFFELGGHSLLAIQVISRLRQDFQLDLSINQLFDNPTIDSLITVITESWGEREIVEEIAKTIQTVNNYFQET
ncbi:MAG: amino acid adenylation domain-containing protein [Cyanobacteria bacterium]|jgi:amino acid adenylation domain-containing protein|nr:amino acid adenylation domain-containing protein [Cyanobacteria bacterium GSL.Bin1]